MARDAWMEGAGQHLFLSEELSDVSVLVHNRCGAPCRFPAHHLVLAARSPVFCQMLNDDFAEKSTRQINIKDFKPQIVKKLLGFMYCGDNNLESWQEAVELLRAAHLYQVTPLVEQCATFLECVLTLGNACHVYATAKVLVDGGEYVDSLSVVKDKALTLIQQYGFIVLHTKAFTLLNKACVEEIISSSSLNIDRELTVYEALKAWAPMHCCRLGKEASEAAVREELSGLLRFVRLDDMSDGEKSALPPAILQQRTPPHESRVEHSVPATVRSHCISQLFAVDGDSSTIIQQGGLKCLSFSVSRPLHLVGLELALSHPWRVTVSLFCENDRLFRCIVDSLVESAAASYASILLRKPCALDPCTVYRVVVDAHDHNAPRCFNAVLDERPLITARGRATVSLHCKKVWGVAQMLFL